MTIPFNSTLSSHESLHIFAIIWSIIFRTFLSHEIAFSAKNYKQKSFKETFSASFILCQLSQSKFLIAVAARNSAYMLLELAKILSNDLKFSTLSVKSFKSLSA